MEMKIKQGWIQGQRDGISELLHNCVQTSRYKGDKSKNKELTKINNKRIF